MMESLLFLVGVLAALWAPPGAVAAALVLFVAAALLSIRHCRVMAAMLVLGFGHALLALNLAAVPDLPQQERLLADVYVVGLPVATQRGWQLEADLRFTQLAGNSSVRARLAVSDSRLLPKVGERYRMVVRLTEQMLVRGARRQRNAMLRDHIGVVAQVAPSPLNLRLSTAAPDQFVQRLREQVANRIEVAVQDPAASALLKALAVGATGDVVQQQWQVFNATGVTHLIAISGLHVTFFAMLAMYIARHCWRWVPPLRDHCKRESFAAAIGIALALGYALLAGFSVPAQRTVAMLTAYLIVRCSGRAVSNTWTLQAALLAVLLWDPFAALSAGFWLSFAAVAAIVFLSGAPLFRAQQLHAAIRVQTTVTVALVPVTVAIFGTFATLGPIVNALAIPLFTFLLVPVILLATLACLLPGAAMQWATTSLLQFAAWLTDWTLPILQAVAESRVALLSAHPSVLWYPLALLASVIVLLPLGRVLRALAGLALVSAFIGSSPRLASGALSVEVLDVGASTAVLVATRSHQLLWGVGEVYGSAGQRARNRLLPLLRRRASGKLDVLVTGKLTREALAGTTQLIAAMPEARVVADRPHNRGPELQPCRNQQWLWDGVQFEVRRAVSSGQCWLEVRVAAARVVLAPELDALAVADSGGPGTRGAVLVVLPRAARSASALIGALPGTGSWLVASLAAREWNSATWRSTRDLATARRIPITSTATHGSITWHIAADGSLRERANGW